MKRALFLTTLLGLVVPAMAADIGVSIRVGDPNFYGRIDIGNYPPPTVIYREPMIIESIGRSGPPIYLRVPPGHAKHWDKHCREYDACGQRVYFVQDRWYEDVYVRGRREHRDDWDDDRDEHRGKGHGKGHGKDKHHD